MSTGAQAGGAPAPAAPAPTNGAAPASTQTPAAPANPAGATAAPAQTEAARVEKLLKKIRVGGKDEEIDMAAHATVMELQRARHEAHQRAQFLKERGDWNRTLERLKGGDLGVLEEAGVNLQELVANAAREREQLAQLTPEQQELAQLKQELARQKAEKERETSERQRAEKQAQAQAFKKKTFTELMDAAKAAGMSLETRGERGAALALAARIRASALKAGMDLTPEQLGHELEKATFGELGHKLKAVTSNPAVRARRAAELKALRDASLSGLDGDALLDALGDERVKQIYAAGMQRLQRKNGPGGEPAAAVNADGTKKVESFAEARAKYGFG